MCNATDLWNLFLAATNKSKIDFYAKYSWDSFKRSRLISSKKSWPERKHHQLTQFERGNKFQNSNAKCMRVYLLSCSRSNTLKHFQPRVKLHHKTVVCTRSILLNWIIGSTSKNRNSNFLRFESQKRNSSRICLFFSFECELQLYIQCYFSCFPSFTSYGLCEIFSLAPKTFQKNRTKYLH